MVKIVRYNGGTESYYGCTEPTELVKGKHYEVVHEKVRSWQTDYVLKGIKGCFNSCWFDKISVEKPAFMAIAHEIPKVGERCKCSKLDVVNGSLNIFPWSTSPVREILVIENNIYKVKTNNSIYIIEVI